mmetsp:Transcript_23297/g.34088  ORF Transcript_23297/g.34088 Transcript_23297/m.34088 type:complete len:221 (+) Transcript_23297:1253-1915(+)
MASNLFLKASLKEFCFSPPPLSPLDLSLPLNLIFCRGLDLACLASSSFTIPMATDSGIRDAAISFSKAASSFDILLFFLPKGFRVLRLKEILPKSNARFSSPLSFWFTLFRIPANAFWKRFGSSVELDLVSLSASSIWGVSAILVSASFLAAAFSFASFRAEMKRSVNVSIWFSAVVNLVIELSMSFCIARVVLRRAEALLNSWCIWYDFSRSTKSEVSS